MSRVDVIIPCYNYARYLRECVESVLAQPVDVRVLIIDDASPDNTAEVAGSLAAQDNRVEFLRHTVNKGHIATYNEGIDWCSGEYTLLLSADDLLVPNALARAVRLLDMYPNVGFVYGRPMRFISGQPLPTPASTAETCPWQVRPGRDWLEHICREGSNLITSPEVVTRTSWQQKLGGYRKELPHSGDMEMWMRFAVHTDVGILDADQAFSRIHAQNMHLRHFGAVMADLEQVKAAYDTVFQEQAAALEDRDRLQRLAYQSMARNAFWTACQMLDNGEADDALLDDLVAFARRIHPNTNQLRGYWGLRLRRLFGASFYARLRRLRAAKGTLPEPISP